MHTQRLEKMVELLDRIDHTIKAGYLDHSAFDLVTWKESNRECGTASCAVGFACTDEWFNREGLAFNKYNMPEFRGASGWRAVNSFFDLNEDDSFYLFSASEYNEGRRTLPDTVARRITRFLNRN